MLLSFFSQEIVAHSATLFAALGGAFFFLRYLRPKEWSHSAWRIPFSVIAALLVTGAIYSGFRIISYGQLANIVYGDPDPKLDVSKYCSLSSYYQAITDEAQKRASGTLLNQIGWIFSFPQNRALPYVGSIWGVLTIVALCLLSRSQIHSPFLMPKRLVKPREWLGHHWLAITIAIIIVAMMAAWVFLPH
jgi:hypothetical protein